MGPADRSFWLRQQINYRLSSSPLAILPIRRVRARWQSVDNAKEASRRHNREFGKRLEIGGIEGVDSAYAVCLHGRNNVQAKGYSHGPRCRQRRSRTSAGGVAGGEP